MSGAALLCPVHPDREGAGICVACRRVVCADCATKLDGINHCRECLQKKLGKATPAAPSALWRHGETLFALGAQGAVFLALLGAYTGLGLAAGDIGWFGGGLTKTARAMDDAVSGLTRFRQDVGRYPRPGEGLRALIDDEPDPSAPAISGWEGPYVYGDAVQDGDIRDGYGSRLRYIAGQGRARPGVLSIGANRELETDLQALQSGDPASGDDGVRWVP